MRRDGSQVIGWAGSSESLEFSQQTTPWRIPHPRLHGELITFLCHHSRFADHLLLVLLARMVRGLLLSQTVCFDQGKGTPLRCRCLAASWQRRAQCWLSNGRIDGEAVSDELPLWGDGSQRANLLLARWLLLSPGLWSATSIPA